MAVTSDAFISGGLVLEVTAGEPAAAAQRQEMIDIFAFARIADLKKTKKNTKKSEAKLSRGTSLSASPKNIPCLNITDAFPWQQIS